MVAIAAVVAVGVLGFAILRFGSSDPKSVGTAATSAPSSSPASIQAADSTTTSPIEAPPTTVTWVKFVPPDQSFVAHFPETPVFVAENVELVRGGQIVHAVTLEVGDNGGYSVVYFDIRANVDKLQVLQELVDDVNADDASDTLSIGEEMTIDKRLAYNLSGSMDGVENRGFAMFGGRRVYVIFAGGVDDANIQRFLDSFEPT